MPQPDQQPPSGRDASHMLPRNVSTSQPELERHLLALLDAVDEPVSVATAIRDRDGRILDFRIDFVNLAAARWAGAAREVIIGLVTGDLLPEFRASGFFDTLRDVVETGRPYSREGGLFANSVTGGSWVGGIHDLRAIRLGDGYLSTWRVRELASEPG